MAEHCAAVALGSNIGDSAATLQGAIDALAAAPGVSVLAVSRVVETDPVGGPEQDDYLNAVVLVRTTLEALALLDVAQGVEQMFGRTREVRWGPRTLDIDLLAFDDLILDSERLTLPHPRAHERGFVLVPWFDVDRNGMIPGRGRIADLLATVDRDGVRPSEVVLVVPARDHS